MARFFVYVGNPGISYLAMGRKSVPPIMTIIAAVDAFRDEKMKIEKAIHPNIINGTRGVIVCYPAIGTSVPGRPRSRRYLAPINTPINTVRTAVAIAS